MVDNSEFALVRLYRNASIDVIGRLENAARA